jgi:ornithine cyclodeaminase/alanine dehydrogenase-like protein (mu-crystallin family)
VRPFTQIRVAGRNPDKVEALVAEVTSQLRGGSALSSPEVVGASSYREACIGADVVCATTDSPQPVVRREWLSPGAHVTSVGFSSDGPEIDGATVADSLLVVESRETAFAGHPVGPHDLSLPLANGLIGEDHIAAEIGELVAGIVEGRTADDQLTLYKSAGVAAQDVAAAKLIHDAALAAGIGTVFHR